MDFGVTGKLGGHYPAEQVAKRKRREEYARLNEEAALNDR